MSSFIKHFAAIICPDTGIQANMYYEEKNKKQTRQSHHPLFANRGSEHFRPFHKLCSKRERERSIFAKVLPERHIRKRILDSRFWMLAFKVCKTQLLTRGENPESNYPALPSVPHQSF